MAELYIVEFKGSRKEYFYNSYYHNLRIPEPVITQAERGEDIGVLSVKVEQEMDFPEGERPRSILRPANPEDITREQEIRDKERLYRKEVIQIIRRYGLVMKVVDIELQFDGNKMTIFFTAEHRVDFRELVKELAAKYRTRIELRQIGVRDEARRIGGFGICGRRQCCNTHIKEFAPITTQHAREQDLPLNPAKISGNCGRLLCCLKYEADVYSSLKRQFPQPGQWIRSDAGDGIIQRIDYFTEKAVVRNAEGAVFRVAAEEIREKRNHPPQYVVAAMNKQAEAEQNADEPVDEPNNEPIDETPLPDLPDDFDESNESDTVN
jgi:cell fate regulator YaaT (PSP1 superfamily)